MYAVNAVNKQNELRLFVRYSLPYIVLLHGHRKKIESGPNIKAHAKKAFNILSCYMLTCTKVPYLSITISLYDCNYTNFLR